MPFRLVNFTTSDLAQPHQNVAISHFDAQAYSIRAREDDSALSLEDTCEPGPFNLCRHARQYNSMLRLDHLGANQERLHVVVGFAAARRGCGRWISHDAATHATT